MLGSEITSVEIGRAAVAGSLLDLICKLACSRIPNKIMHIMPADCCAISCCMTCRGLATLPTDNAFAALMSHRDLASRCVSLQAVLFKR